MPSRTRNNSTKSGVDGKFYQAVPRVTISTSIAPLRTRVTTDVTGNPRGENPFESETVEWIYSSVSGQLGNYVRDNWTPEYIQSIRPDHLTSLVGRFTSYTDGIANSHPGEPAVDIPLFLFEMKDLPGMISHAGRRGLALSKSLGRPKVRDIRKLLHRRGTSEDWLNYHFGWSPFIKDLIDIYGIARDMEKRTRMMRSMRSNLVSRYCPLGEANRSTVTGAPFIYGNPGACSATLRTTTTQKKWVVSHWQADPMVFQAALSSQWQNLRYSLGLEVTFETIYNAIPWSWLVDWFSGVGAVVKIHSNRMGMRFINASQMTHTLTKQVAVPQNPRYAMSDATFTRERKSRLPVTPTILPTGLNYLNSAQLGTLSALAVTRARL